MTLVAIARNEGPYIVEWLAHHLAIGFDRIVVYDNESTDDTGRFVRAISMRDIRVRRVPWPSPSNDSAQVLAYQHARTHVDTSWVMYLDIDEFLVPFAYDGMAELIGSLPDDVSSLHVNWRGFGSSGLTEPSYDCVTRAFTRCSLPSWGNNGHFKTLARVDRITDVLIHDLRSSRGRRVLSDGRGFANTSDGTSDRIVHEGVQINHYQCKTWPEFQARMRRGDANFPNGHPGRQRDSSIARFDVLDRNEAEDYSIQVFRPAFDAELCRLRDILGDRKAPYDCQ